MRIVKKNLSAGRPTAPEAAPVAPRLGRLCTIAAAVATLAFPMADAWALSLGRIAVQSALGQPLRAEIDIPAITPDEAGSLTAVVAPLSAFKSAGMDYNAVLSGVRIQLQPRGDGRAVLQLTSDRVINDPFVDLIIEANWASGRIVRDYTLLFDPPEMARNAPQAITVAPPPPRQPDYTPAPAAAAPAPVTPIFYPPPPSAFRPSPANSGPSRLPPPRLEEAQRATAELAANIQSQAVPLPPGRGPLPAAPRSSTASDGTPSRFSPAQVAAARAAVANQTAALPAPGVAPAAGSVTPPIFYPPPPSAFRPSPTNSGPTQLSPARLEEARRATAALAGQVQSQAGPGRSDNAAPRAADTAGNQQLKVRPGDSAARIAAANKPANISLDQMLVALQRQNPDAFVGNNVNRLRAGAVLTLPTAAQAEAVTPQEASRTVVAQSRDFNTFRRRLAEGVPAAQVDAASREARGKLQAQVAEPKTSATTPDKLTLSKGTGTTEDKLASSRQAQEASNRVAELSKNLGDLARLKSGSSALAGSAAASAAGAGIPVTAATPPAVVTSAPVAAASATAPTATAGTVTVPSPVITASAPAAPAEAASTVASAPAKPKPVAAPILAREEPGFLDDLLDNPLLLPLGGGLLLALLVFGIFRMRQNRHIAQSSLAYPDSRLTGDSLTGSNGKMRDPLSSMGYSPSQLDAAGDVDPVEEADVYLAYGRDQQAEEILKEALQRGPTRLAVHAKLLEIYAKRRDVQAFDHQAAEAFHVSKGQGSEWARIRALGQELNPANSLYRPESPAATAAALAAALAPAPADPPVHFGQPAMTVPGAATAAPLAPAPGAALDFDLDFSADDAGKTAPPLTDGTARKEPTLFGDPAPATPAPAPQDSLPPVHLAPSSDLPDLVFDVPPVAPPRRPEPVAPPVMTMAPAATEPAADMIKFDLDSLSLEPLTPSPVAGSAGSATPDHPLEIKLELAVEFMAIGDNEGARALIEEVVPQATGAIKARAQQMLAELRR